MFNNKVILGSSALSRVGETELVKSIKFVGMHLDEKLNFKRHIQEVEKKLKQQAYLIIKNKNAFPIQIKILLYNSLFRPHLEYGIIVWSRQPKIGGIRTQQKKVIRAVANCHNWRGHTNPIFQSLSILKIDDLITLNISKFGYQAAKGILPEPIQALLPLKAATRCTREGNKTLLMNESLSTNGDSIIARIVNNWNKNIGEKMKKMNKLQGFKKALNKELLLNYKAIPDCKIQNCRSCLFKL
jgi:hypothetical protein